MFTKDELQVLHSALTSYERPKTDSDVYADIEYHKRFVKAQADLIARIEAQLYYDSEIQQRLDHLAQQIMNLENYNHRGY